MSYWIIKQNLLVKAIIKIFKDKLWRIIFFILLSFRNYFSIVRVRLRPSCLFIFWLIFHMWVSTIWFSALLFQLVFQCQCVRCGFSNTLIYFESISARPLFHNHPLFLFHTLSLRFIPIIIDSVFIYLALIIWFILVILLHVSAP